MKRLLIALFWLIPVALFAQLKYPDTKKENIADDYNGVKVEDPYRWLEDQNSPETRAWIDAQNAYSDGMLSKLPGREALRQQVSALIKIDSMGAPSVTNNRYFFSKHHGVEATDMLEHLGRDSGRGRRFGVVDLVLAVDRQQLGRLPWQPQHVALALAFHEEVLVGQPAGQRRDRDGPASPERDLRRRLLSSRVV